MAATLPERSARPQRPKEGDHDEAITPNPISHDVTSGFASCRGASMGGRRSPSATAVGRRAVGRRLDADGDGSGSSVAAIASRISSGSVDAAAGVR